MSRALTTTPQEPPPKATLPSGSFLSIDDVEAAGWAFVGGALIADLDLRANLTLAFDCCDAPAPDWLETELTNLFEAAGAALGPGWAESLPESAAPLACLAARVGRALAADPDGLAIDAATWPDELIAPETFEHAYRTRYPWRGLRWLDGGQT